MKIIDNKEAERFDIYLQDFKRNERSILIILNDLSKRTSNIEECNILRDIMDWFSKIIVIYPNSYNMNWEFRVISADDSSLTNILSNLNAGIKSTAVKVRNLGLILEDLPNKDKDIKK